MLQLHVTVIIVGALVVVVVSAAVVKMALTVAMPWGLFFWT